MISAHPSIFRHQAVFVIWKMLWLSNNTSTSMRGAKNGEERRREERKSRKKIKSDDD
jgi:hypothetical protein